MANFVVFTNANETHSGNEIVINVDNIVSIFRDTSADNKVALWSKENFWHVEEDFNTVMKKIKVNYKEKVKKTN